LKDYEHIHGKREAAFCHVQATSARNMDLWKTINPGAMPQHAQTPVSTAHAHYAAVDGGDSDGGYGGTPPDKRFNIRKNENSEHAEQAAGIMKALIKSI
jgi:hypothetical protein